VSRHKPHALTALVFIVLYQGWLLGTFASNDPSRPGPASNNLNMALPALRSWYAGKQAHYLKDGVDFWWNDEGETEYSTYHLWYASRAVQFHPHGGQIDSA